MMIEKWCKWLEKLIFKETDKSQVTCIIQKSLSKSQLGVGVGKNYEGSGMRERRKKEMGEFTKFLNPAVALKVRNLNYLKTTSLSATPRSSLERHWQLPRPVHVWASGDGTFSGTPPPSIWHAPSSLCLAVTKVTKVSLWKKIDPFICFYGNAMSEIYLKVRMVYFIAIFCCFW